MQNPLSHQLLTTGMNDIHVKPDEDNHFVWMVYDAEAGGGVGGGGGGAGRGSQQPSGLSVRMMHGPSEIHPH